MTDPGRCDLHYFGLFDSRAVDRRLERTVLLWWYFAVDRCGRSDGLHGSSTGACDVAAVRRFNEESEFEKYRWDGINSLIHPLSGEIR